MHSTAVERARAIRIEDEIARRGIRLRGRIEMIGPCPRCGGTDRFAINTRKQIWNCRALVQWLDGCGFREATDTLSGCSAASAPLPLVRMAARERRAQQEGAATAEEAQRSAEALAMWAEAADPRGTPVETYLQWRGLTLADDAAGEAIRFHPRCKFGLARVPCMVALVRDVVTDEPRAIHRTAITEAGEKFTVNGLGRMTLGPVGGGAVKLTPDADVTLCLGIGEGIESTLSLRLAIEFGASPVWALLSAGQVEQFPVLAGIEALWIAVDHDEAGVKAARECAARWRKAGREVFMVRPRAELADLNDLVKVA